MSDLFGAMHMLDGVVHRLPTATPTRGRHFSTEFSTDVDGTSLTGHHAGTSVEHTDEALGKRRHPQGEGE
jgi:hypothetical protein